MVFAIETYCPATDGYSGARIEEEVVVTDKGCKVITLFPAEELPITHRYCGRRRDDTARGPAGPLFVCRTARQPCAAAASRGPGQRLSHLQRTRRIPTSMTQTFSAAPPAKASEPLMRGLRGRCPACGEGRMFRKFLKFADASPA